MRPGKSRSSGPGDELVKGARHDAFVANNFPGGKNVSFAIELRVVDPRGRPEVVER